MYYTVIEVCCQAGVPGTLPASWAQGWTNVTWLQISNMSGEIPAAWFAPGAFQQLYNLDLSNGQLSGELACDIEMTLTRPCCSTCRYVLHSLSFGIAMTVILHV